MKKVEAKQHPNLKAGEYRVIARLTGISPQHVMRVLKGESDIALKKAWKIADVAGVTLDEMRAHIVAVEGEKVKDKHATINSVAAAQAKRPTTVALKAVVRK